jgi:hypothetical protein
LADSAVQVTQGTGTNIDTRTEGTNGNHRQVVVLGDPATNAGVAPVDATNGLAVDVKQSALPTGAATAAKQPTPGTAGAASADVLSVQGIASMVPLLTSATLQAGTNLAGRISSSDETSTIYNATTALTPKFAPIAASTNGNNTLVAAVTSKKIRVLSLWLGASGAVNAKFQSGSSGTDLTGLAYLTQYSGYVLPYNPVGWFESASGVLLNLNLSGAVAVGGSLTYIEV